MKKIAVSKPTEQSPWRAHRDYEAMVTDLVSARMLKLFLSIRRKWLGMEGEFKKADDDEFFHLNGKIFISPQTGKPLTKIQWQAVLKSLDQAFIRMFKDVPELIAGRAMLLGKILDGMEYDQRVKTPLKEIEEIPARIEQDRQWENAVLFAEHNTGELMVNLQATARKNISTTILDAIQNKRTPRQLESALFDDFGDINRDWRRIAATETSTNLNDGMLLTELEDREDGETRFMIGISAPGACPACERLVSGQVVVLTDEPGNGTIRIGKESYPVIWPGKNNVGRKAAGYWVCPTIHPHCRCSWTRYYPEMAALMATLKPPAKEKEKETGPKYRLVSSEMIGRNKNTLNLDIEDMEPVEKSLQYAWTLGKSKYTKRTGGPGEKSLQYAWTLGKSKYTKRTGGPGAFKYYYGQPASSGSQAGSVAGTSLDDRLERWHKETADRKNEKVPVQPVSSSGDGAVVNLHLNKRGGGDSGTQSPSTQKHEPVNTPDKSTWGDWVKRGAEGRKQDHEKAVTEYKSILKEHYGDIKKETPLHQQQGLQKYTSIEYKAINGALESGKPTPEQKQTIAGLRDYIKEVPLAVDMTLYRGVAADVNWEVGQVIQNSGFTSMSSSKNIARGFSLKQVAAVPGQTTSKGALIVVNAKKGDALAPTDGMGTYKDKEAEFIGTDGMKMRITGVTEEGGRKTYEMEIVQ